jgi:uncharacterized protein
MTRLEQLRQKRDEILAIADKYGATNLRIFGSVARGDDQENRWSLFDHIGMMQDLEELLECKVDVAVAKGLRQRFYDRITKEAVAL